MPRQIDSCHLLKRQTTQQRNTRVATVEQIDRFLEVEPPLSFNRRHTARNSRWFVSPVHLHLLGQFLSDVVTAAAYRAFVRFLQCEHVDARQECAFGEYLCRPRDLLTDVLRTASKTHQANLASQAARDQVRAARVTDVV